VLIRFFVACVCVLMLVSLSRPAEESRYDTSRGESKFTRDYRTLGGMGVLHNN
jgi:hypothetical protein